MIFLLTVVYNIKTFGASTQKVWSTEITRPYPVPLDWRQKLAEQVGALIAKGAEEQERKFEASASVASHNLCRID